MNQIKCPHCGQAFTIDEAGYAEIVRQVRSAEFQAEVHERLTAAAADKANALAVAKAEAEARLQKVESAKDARISELTAALDAAAAKQKAALDIAAAQAATTLETQAADKDAQIAQLRAELTEAKTASRLAIQETAAQKDARIAALTAELKAALDGAAAKQKAALDIAAAQAATTLETQAADKDAQIAQLRAELTEAKTASRIAVQETAAEKDARIAALTAALDGALVKQELAVQEAVTAVEKERDALAAKLDASAAEAQLQAVALREAHAKEVMLLNETIDAYKDFKARLSTKLLGETLEQHCELSFEQLRATAFQTASFGKDNDASSGSKGDYIFRDTSGGVEYISIMFEMKNEADATATKRRNEDFLKELDKDRREKGCEYAVLVSLLEPDSDLYNRGIVDVSHKYDRMYVIRPQFFIPMITLLRNAAQGSIAVRTELERIQEQNIDITNFETTLKGFQDTFKARVGKARNQYEAAIKTIDTAIANLEKIKEAMRLWTQHLDVAGRGLEEVTIRKLTKGNPTMTARFEALALEADEATR